MGNLKSNLDKLKEAMGIVRPSEELIKDDLIPENTDDATTETPKIKVEEWVWVEGYKGMDKDMQCHDGFQYEIGKRYDMPEDVEVKVCHAGFHFCKNLNDVFTYVQVGNNNRFFRVRGLVRKSDADTYGETEYRRDGFYGLLMGPYTNDKLAAQSIEILEELTTDEILEPFGYGEWSDKYKQLAISVDIEAARKTEQIDILEGYGYSLPFATWLVNDKKYDVAKAVGSQSDLSMDMKVLMIMNSN